jgi:hypothetical protein
MEVWVPRESSAECRTSRRRVSRAFLRLALVPLAPLAIAAMTLGGATPALAKHADMSAPSQDSRSAGAISLYVSPSGADTNPGTYLLPFRTLTHARNSVRTLNHNMAADITVYLDTGIYRLARPLLLGPRDSGTNGHNVVWTAAPGATPVISGAQRISGWKPSDTSKNIWSAHVPRNLDTRQVYVNGMRATLASGRPPVSLTRTATGYWAGSAAMSTWRNPSDIEFVYISQLGQMTEPICPIQSIKGRAITMAQPCWDNSNRRVSNMVGYGTLRKPDYVENAYELLLNPGQFYLDRTAGLLYYIPREGEDMRTADVEAPHLQTLVTGVGSPTNFVHNITFSNLQFSYATWLQPNTRVGFSEMQSGYTVTGPHGYATQGLCKYARQGSCPYGSWTKEPGNLEFRFDRSLSFLNDRFIHLGAAALNLDDGSHNDTVAGSIFTDVSGNGVEVGSVDMPKAKGAFQTTGISVTNNHLFGMPVEYEGGVPILVGYAAFTTISHNQVDHVPYSGISLGWGGWPDKIGSPAVANFSHNNVVSDNLVYDFMETVSDGGGIYTQGVTGTSISNGERVIGNVVHGQVDWSFALHSDNGATYVTYAGNVLYDDTYDWCCNHTDFRRHARAGGSPILDAQQVVGNYWQGGQASMFTKRVTIAGNRVITGPEQAPSSIVSAAGIEPRVRSILSWHDSGESLPSPPDRVNTLYAYDGRAYITWHPAINEGGDPLVSYAVSSCLAAAVAEPAPCTPPVMILAGAFERLGYAMVSGLTNGTKYVFIVTAYDGQGAGTPSVPSPVTVEGSDVPSLPGKAKWVVATAGQRAVSLSWQPPASEGCVGPWWAGTCRHPVLKYIVTSSSGKSWPVTGLSQLVVSNGGGRALHVFGGLVARRAYRFSVSAWTPSGTGPPLTSKTVTPTS